MEPRAESLYTCKPTGSIAPSYLNRDLCDLSSLPLQKVEFFQAISRGNDQLEYSKVTLYCQQGIGAELYCGGVDLGTEINITMHTHYCSKVKVRCSNYSRSL